MEIEGVLVTYNLNVTNTRPPEFASSGLKFNKNWVLVHGSALSPLKAAHDLISNEKKEYMLCGKKCRNVHVDIAQYNHTNQSNDQLIPNITVSKGKFVYMWKCSLLKSTVDNLLSDWILGVDKTSENENAYDKKYLSLFAVIYIGNESVSKMNIDESLGRLYELTLKRPPIRGEEIHLECTPFGNKVFLNSRTVGIVCNCVGYENCLMITDATSALCCEGGPAFSGDEKYLFGIIISSLSWWKGEWVGMTLVANLAPCLYKFCNIKNNRLVLEHNISTKQILISNLLERLDSSIVLVRCGDTWGSGVSIGNGYYLTCSHVLINHEQNNVSVHCKGKTINANLLIKTSYDKAYDLALLRANTVDIDSTPVIEFASSPAVKGEIVVAVGYPYFSEYKIRDIKPTISKGCINNVTPFMLQTSCCVQSGFSGGAILRFYKKTAETTVTCELLGIIVCNVKNEITTASYPYVNMAIPVNAFKKTLNKILSNSEHSTFEDNRQAVQQLWKFQFPSNL